jgi:glutamate racemase
MNIGVFDSGLGGLSILKAFRENLPQYHYLYLGDNLHVPYGNQDPKKITSWARKIIPFFIKKNCPLVIFACNTITATSLPKIQKEFADRIKVLGIVRPTTEFLLNQKGKKIGIIGTTNTVNSNIFNQDLAKINQGKAIKFYQQDCPGLVREIEKGFSSPEKIKMVLCSCLGPLQKKEIDILILGCTHYNLIADQIQAFFSKTKIITQGEIAAQKLAQYLNRHTELEKKLAQENKLTLYFTKKSRHYPPLINSILGRSHQYTKLKKAKIDF